MGQKLRRRCGSYARSKQSRDITKIKQMKSPTINACQITLGLYTICKASHHSVNNEFGPTRKCFVAYCTYFTTSLIFILYILSLYLLQVSRKELTRAIMRSDLF